ncbi:MAG: peptidylprolyl isomerase [Akkermansiaceae bacterium]|nr:peptidylprolyl isomerase [Akkermansiaceae bacterium]
MKTTIKTFGLTLMMAVTGCLTSCAEENNASTSKTAAPSDGNEAKSEAVGDIKDIRIELNTSKGKIEATIFASKVPMTAANYLNLAKRGYYEGLKFHRVIPNFMIQGGDPQGTGRGGPGYRFGDEFDPSLKHDGPGVFSMANSGPSTNGSQFFVTHKDTPWLDGRHSVFGKVTKGMEVVNAITGGDTIASIKVLDSTDALFAAQQENLAKWNAVLGDK